ncbi:hypothetical protein PVT67_17425 [Gallaecimonas kandeliae]|uniref:hypothetical protein n=1 Tax=Gallaecimonas kandeliae TaxID=3029055 RepID=UPI0026483937|nr:hypothetical protein [Gallaecimonas kandeliae]WKE65424.1 hypothetical protein PVT67_17425 [Gallaecimonas kandeliae]
MELPYHYKSLDLDMLTLFEKVGSEKLGLKIFQQSDTNLSLVEDWVPFDCSLFEMPEAEALQKPDIFLWLDIYLVLNKKAYDTLAPSLNNFGEFLPLTVNGEPHHLFNCLIFGQENEAKTTYKYDAGIPTGLTHLEFVEEDKILFKSQISFCGSLFCNDNFKMLCEESFIKGLRFEENLLTAF